MNSQIIGTIGLLCDIIGAILVAVEVVSVYHGDITGTMNDAWETHGKPTPEYKRFEKRKRKIMGVGLVFLLTGFSLQIVALWIK